MRNSIAVAQQVGDHDAFENPPAARAKTSRIGLGQTIGIDMAVRRNKSGADQVRGFEQRVEIARLARRQHVHFETDRLGRGKRLQ